MGQSSICGLAITTECSEVEIKEVNALEFLIWYLDSFAELLSKSKKPRITASLFAKKENAENSITLVPVGINDLHPVESRKGVSIRMNLFTAETVKDKAFPTLLAMLQVALNINRHVCSKQSLTFTTNLSIINNSQAVLQFLFTKSM